MIWETLLIFWVLLDLVYFISVSYMFLHKLREITYTYHTFIITVTKQDSLASASGSLENNINNQEQPTHANNKDHQNDHSNRTCKQPVNGHNNNTNNNNNSNNGNISLATVNRTNQRQIVEKKKIYQLLSQTMKVYTRLTVVIVTSSACVFAAVMAFGMVLEAQGFGIMFISVDATINGVCLLLYFQNARSFYCKLVSKCANVFLWLRCDQ